MAEMRSELDATCADRRSCIREHPTVALVGWEAVPRGFGQGVTISAERLKRLGAMTEAGVEVGPSRLG